MSSRMRTVPTNTSGYPTTHLSMSAGESQPPLPPTVLNKSAVICDLIKLCSSRLGISKSRNSTDPSYAEGKAVCVFCREDIESTPTAPTESRTRMCKAHIELRYPKEACPTSVQMKGMLGLFQPTTFQSFRNHSVYSGSRWERINLPVGLVRD